MLYILSPTKTMHDTTETIGYGTAPKYLKKTQALAKELKALSQSQINKLMPMSEKLQVSTINGYKSFNLKPKIEKCSSSVMTYSGEAYVSMNPLAWNKTQRNYADKHVRLLSGLYGILKPSDLIQNYRLEMGAKAKGVLKQSLYEYWTSTITEEINEILDQHKNKTLINLASNEYSKSISKDLRHPMISLEFKEFKNDKLKVISFNAKRARGMMVDYIVRNKIDDPVKLKKFNLDGYNYQESDKQSTILFVR